MQAPRTPTRTRPRRGSTATRYAASRRGDTTAVRSRTRVSVPVRPGPPPSSSTPTPERGGRSRVSPRVRRRRITTIFFLGVVTVLALVAVAMSGGSPPPLTRFRSKIVIAADSQLGYTTDPSSTYCNKFSAYWQSGTGCSNGLRAEEWCADFAAWAWQQAGAQFVYAYTSGDINAAAASFYEWAVDHHTWHAANSGYVPKPGDVAVYGLDAATRTAAHVAVVTSDTSGARGPNVVNGDGDRTGFSVVEAGTDQYQADTHGGAGPLSGYASPIPPQSAHGSTATT